LLAAQVIASAGTSEVVAASAIEWGYLNPLRGKLSPGAADLWGDRTADKATGMLVRFNKGFSSPPHIHNITYRGVVIEGLMHNDDPGAEIMWLPTGSFWTQPAGENHITAADGETNMIYLEIDSGPYLVQPADGQFDNGERPLNLHDSNIVWLDKSDVHRIAVDGAKSTFLWGSVAQGELGGSMVKLPSGFKGQIATEASEFRAVVIQGEITYNSVDLKEEQLLSAGSYFGSNGGFEHEVSVQAKSEVTLYIRANDKYRIQ
jgi:quercetin dioxygenase-like cupin family protein